MISDTPSLRFRRTNCPLRSNRSTNPVAFIECVRTCFLGFVAHVGRIYAGVVGRRPPNGRSSARRAGRSRRRPTSPAYRQSIWRPRRSTRAESLPRLSKRWRHVDSVEARSAWTVAAAPAGDRHRPEGARYRVPIANRADEYATPHGELLFSLFGALAQYERALTRERVMAGLAAAKRRGRQGGRPPMIDAETLERITAALDGGASKAAVCRTFKVPRSTLLGTLDRVGCPPPAKA
jgi:hypothetical protein